MPAGQIVGRISIKVLPDTDDFRSRLRKELSAIQKSIRPVKAKLELDIDRRMLTNLKRQLKGIKDDLNHLDGTVHVDMGSISQKIVAFQLAKLARDRIVNYRPRVDQSALAKAGTALAALSGGRAIGTLGSDFAQFLQGLDKAVPKIALVATALAGLGAVGITSISNLAAISVTLAQIAGAGLALPGILAGMGVGLGITVIAMKDFKKVLPDVARQFAAMRKEVSTNFWDKAKDGIRSLVTLFLPQLADTAKEVGNFWGKMAQALSKPFHTALGTMFDNLEVAIRKATGGVDVFASIITTLGLEGSNFLPQLAGWFVDIATTFDNWLKKISASGELKDFVNAGVANLAALGGVLTGLGGIIGGIGKAALAGGGAPLATFADTLHNIADTINTPAFQGTLTAVFTSAHAAISALATGAAPGFTAFIDTLSAALTYVLPLAGQVIGDVVGAIGNALSDPTVLGGVINFFTAIQTAVAAILPAIGPLGQTFGALASTIGVLVGSIGTSLGALLTGLAPIFTALLISLQPIIGILGGVLLSAITGLMPAFQAFGGLLTTVLGALGPAFQQIGSALGPVFATLGTTLASIMTTLGPILSEIIGALAPVFTQLATAIGSLLPLAGQLITALLPLLSAILVPLAAILAALIPVIVQVLSAILPPLISVITTLVAALTPILAVIGQIVAAVVNFLAPVFVFLAKLLAGVVTGLLGGFASFFQGVMSIFDGFRTIFQGGWSNFWTGLGQILSGVWQVIVGLFNIIINIGVLGILRRGMLALKALWTAGWAAVKTVLSVLGSDLRNILVKLGVDLLTIPSRALISLKSAFSSAWTAIKSAAQLLWDALPKGFSKAITSVVTFVQSLPGKIVSALGDVGSILSGVGGKIIDGLVAGIRTSFGKVKGALGDLTGKLTSWKGPESLDKVILFNAGTLIIDGFINGLESRYDAVRKSLGGLTDMVGGTVIDAPRLGPTGSIQGAVNGALGTQSTTPAAGVVNNFNMPISGSDLTPEDVADSILFATRRMASGGVYARMVSP